MTPLADRPRLDLPDGTSAIGARSNASGQVVVTAPQPAWPFMRIGDKDKPVNEPRAQDGSAAWLRSAMIALGALAIVSATVSYSAQFVMVDAAREITFISALEAGIPDVGALIFASLGIALALHGRRAIRARMLNLAAVATSVFMNYAAAGHGWRDLAIWVMPPVAYALASDTAIGVVRAWSIAPQQQLDETLADDEATPLAIFGRIVLYGLRFVLAPPSTARGVRRMLLNATPLPPSAIEPPTDRKVLPSAQDRERRARKAAGPTKTARFLGLVAERYGPLAEFDLAKVSRVAGELAPAVGLHAGSARSALRKAVLAAQKGSGQ
jgi:hypothetical protein